MNNQQINRKITLGEEIELEIEKLVYGGLGLAHYAGKSILVKYVIPNEKIKARYLGKKKGIHWAELIEIIDKDINRIEAKCPLFGKCGGCYYQHISYAEQLYYKEHILQELFPNHSLEPTIYNSNIQYSYRNKCEFTFADSRTSDYPYINLGMHEPGKYFEVLDIQYCHILPDLLNKILFTIREKVNNLYYQTQDDRYLSYRDKTEEGFWQNITIRYATDKNNKEQLLLIWRVKDPSDKNLKEISLQLMEQYTEIKGVFAIPSPRGEMIHLCGENLINQAIGDLSYQYYPENFFQINLDVLPMVLEHITKVISNIKGIKYVLDLFSGVGLLGIYIANYLIKQNSDILVRAAEIDERSALIANHNASLNNLNNYKSYHLDLYKKGWKELFYDMNGSDLVLILDPPRAGMTPKSIQQAIELNPRVIIYMSCNPTTQKRDIELFTAEHYHLNSIQLIDMFPQTYHIESLAVLSRKEV